VSEQKFKAVITPSGTRAVIALPFDPRQVWGARERYHITGSVNDCKIRGPLVLEGDRYVLPLGAAWRRDNHLAASGRVQVRLSLEGPQSALLAPDLAAALAPEPAASAFFDALPTFYRKNYMRWVDSAKRPATRAARVAELVKLLKAGQRER
jgi:hypothetical protein